MWELSEYESVYCNKNMIQVFIIWSHGPFLLSYIAFCLASTAAAFRTFSIYDLACLFSTDVLRELGQC